MVRSVTNKEGHSFSVHIKEMLLYAHSVVNSNKTNLNETSLINKNNEVSLELDIQIETRLIEYTKSNTLEASIFSEECGYVNSQQNGPYLIVIDPLDGSINFRLGQGLLPFGTIITVYRQPDLLFSNVVAAGIIEHTTGRGWVCDRKKTRDLRGNIVTIDPKWPLNPQTPIYFDLYTKQDFNHYLPLPRQFWVRSTGCLAGNLHYLLSGITPCIGGLYIKAEEAGALYALVTRSGGLVTDANGASVADNIFNEKGSYTAAAGSPDFTEFLIKLTKKNGGENDK